MQFLGIGRPVEVGERSRDSAVTFKSALHFYPDLVSGRVPAYSYISYGGRAGICSVPVEWPAMSD